MRRLIFTLLHDRGQFMLSRNFRLQGVGGLRWLFDNYAFSRVSHGLDELMVLDVSRGVRDADAFGEVVAHIAQQCFIPVTVGGGIDSIETAQRYMRNGADKLLLNTAFKDDPGLCQALASHFGRQCIVAGIDYKFVDGRRSPVVANGTRSVGMELSEWVQWVEQNGAGEILLQSVDQDGTGMGLDLDVVDGLETLPDAPCILAGGVGKAEHILAGLQHSTVDAVATANLFNFIGDAFLDVRRTISHSSVTMAHWDETDYLALQGCLRPVQAPQVGGDQ